MAFSVLGMPFKSRIRTMRYGITNSFIAHLFQNHEKLLACCLKLSRCAHIIDGSKFKEGADVKTFLCFCSEALAVRCVVTTVELSILVENTHVSCCRFLGFLLPLKDGDQLKASGNAFQIKEDIKNVDGLNVARWPTVLLA